MRKRALVIVAVACLVGAALAAISTSQYIRIHRQGMEEKSFCSISETIDCDIASASSYSTVSGMPVAWFGLVGYLLMGGMALFGAISKKNRKATVTIAWFGSVFAVLYSIRMAYILVNVLHVACLECIGMYAANLVCFVGLWHALNIPVKDAGGFFANYVRAVFKKSSELGFKPRIIVHAILVLAVFGLGWAVIYNIMGEGAEAGVTLKEKMNAYYMQSLYDVPINPDWPVWGRKDAPVTIIEFSDFQCPFCRLAAFNIRPYLQEFKKDIGFYFVNYPLDQACNPYLDHPMHISSCMAAYAVECGKQRGDFWSFHDDIFKLQKGMTRESLINLAEKRNWNAQEFAACMDSDDTKKRVLADIEAGRKAYISGTPTIIIDGRKIRYWHDSNFLQSVVGEEEKRAKRR